MEPKDFLGPAITLGVLLIVYLLKEGARREKLEAQLAEIAAIKSDIEKLKTSRVDYVELRVRIEELERRTATHKTDLKAEIAELRRDIHGK